MLHQDPGEALHRAEQGAVDHHRALLAVVGVGEVEALRHGEVDLAGAALPGAAQRIGDVEVDLRPVEGAVAGVERVLAVLALQRGAQRLLGLLPLLVAADRLLGPGRELDPHVLEAEPRVKLVDRLADPGHLADDLLRRAVDVGVVLGEGADAEEAVQDALALRSGDLAELGDPQRQLAVGVAVCGVDEAGAGAVHRPDRVLALL